MGYGTVGETYVDDLLAEYVPPGAGFIEDLASDEEKQLLYAILLEQRVQRANKGIMDIQTELEQQRQAVQSGNPEQEGTYDSLDFDLDELQTADDWVEVDLDFVTDEVDLRFDDAVAVAFRDPADESAIVQYDSGESPVIGIPVETSEVHLGAQKGTGGASLTLDAWG